MRPQENAHSHIMEHGCQRSLGCPLVFGLELGRLSLSGPSQTLTQGCFVGGKWDGGS